MDLDAVLARHPEVALVDELAHTNVPGSGRNEKRWQDVIELLDAGIDVITTVNIQHLESIADAVERIIEVPVRERVPDWVVRKADQIELVDSSPEQLRRRMLHGNIYPADQVPQALTHYFRTDNLTALRELALRFLADETEEELLEYLRRQQNGRRVGDQRAHPGRRHRRPRAPTAIVRRAARMARRIKADLQVLHVVAARRRTARSPNDRLIALRQLAADVGAEWNEVRGDDPAQALIDFARAAAHHPDRGRIERPQPLAGAPAGLHRPQDLPAGRRRPPSTCTSSPGGTPGSDSDPPAWTPPTSPELGARPTGLRRCRPPPR